MHVENTVNRALGGDFAKTVITLNFLLWRLPGFSEFLHLPVLVKRKMRGSYTSFFKFTGLRSSDLMTKIR